VYCRSSPFKLSFQFIDDCKFHVGVVLSNVKGKNFKVLCVVCLNDKIKHLGVTIAITYTREPGSLGG
jgi:hypothetical protein